MSEPQAQPPPTVPVYHQDSTLTEHSTTITSIQPFSALHESIQQLFKPPPSSPSDAHVLTTSSTIFHPQGGGQPSDTGTISTLDATVTFTVDAVRQSPSLDPESGSRGQIYHLGTYSPSSTRQFHPHGESVSQTIDAAARHLYSRLHTAGHLLGLAARHHLESPASNSGIAPDQLVDGKASHFPGMANVEFLGPLVAGQHKVGIQRVLDEYVAADLPVHIHEWDEGELRHPGNKVYYDPAQFVLGLLGGGGGDGEGEERRMGLRCVAIGDKGAYPCGGTHVRSTGELGKVKAYKISRVAAKGVSRISYSLE